MTIGRRTLFTLTIIHDGEEEGGEEEQYQNSHPPN